MRIMKHAEVLRLLQISSKAGPHATLLRRRVHTDENKVRVLNSFIHIRREEQVAATCLADNILEARLVDGQIEVRVVPGINSRLV